MEQKDQPVRLWHSGDRGIKRARALDDLGDMFMRRMQHIHNAARLALDRYRAATVECTDGLVTTPHQLLLAHQYEGTIDQALRPSMR